MAIGAIMWMAQHKGSPIYGLPYGGTIFFIGFGAVLAVMYVWWRDVVREAQYQGHHSPVVQLHHRYGMILFILSEVMFLWLGFGRSLIPLFFRTIFTKLLAQSYFRAFGLLRA